MSNNHPEELPENVLVGDGGRSWFAAQHRNQTNQYREQQNKNRYNKHENDSISNAQKDETKLLNKQQKNRLKRQKKKRRKQKYENSNNTNNTNNNTSNSSNNNRSDFLYGNKDNIDNENDNDDTFNPYTKHKKQRKDRNKNLNEKKSCFKTYVKSSNQEELNKIAAQMLKAKLSSNSDLYNELERKLNKLRESSFIIERRYEASSSSQHQHDGDNNNDNKEEKQEKELLDEKGKKIELIMNAKIAKKLHGMNEMNEIDEDDDIDTLLKKEGNRTALDYDKSLFRNKNMKQMMSLNNDDQFDSIDAMKLFSNNDNNKNERKRKREIEKEENQRSLKRARLISQHKSESNWLNSCKFCIENEEIHNKDMSHCCIYYGKYMYLAVPKQECLVKYQCVIIPNTHLKSFREGILYNDTIGASKDEQYEFEKELHLIQKILCKLFKTKYDSNVVFIETVRNLKKNYHSMIYCYPIQFEQFNLCPTYFKKAILESDVMWSTNKKIIEISKDKPLNKSIPHFMPYFYVQFGLNDGYVHIIEDETKIKQDFGAQIIAGIVGKVLFKIKNESFQKQRERGNLFKTIFKPFKETLNSKLKKLKSKNNHDDEEK